MTNKIIIFRHIREFNVWLRNEVSDIQQKYGSAKVFSPTEGRLGSQKVIFVSDPNDTNNLVKIAKDKLTIQSQSAFCTLKANCCIYKGKWMFEVSFIDFFLHAFVICVTVEFSLNIK